MIQLENVRKQYEGATALHSTDLTFKRGETCVLIGPSGCGKSTLLRLALGLIEPTGGTVLFDGEKLSPRTVGTIRQRVGYVIQRGGLFPHLDAAGNVTLLARHLGWPKERREKRLEELRELVRLDQGLMSSYPKQLSGGERQRVALMRALMLEPDALLLDEPLGALDPLARAELQDHLASIIEHLGITVVLVTHDMAEAAHFAGRIVLLQSGRIVQDGSVSDLVEHPSEPFVSEFISAQRSHRF